MSERPDKCINNALWWACDDGKKEVACIVCGRELTIEHHQFGQAFFLLHFDMPDGVNRFAGMLLAFTCSAPLHEQSEVEAASKRVCDALTDAHDGYLKESKEPWEPG